MLRFPVNPRHLATLTLPSVLVRNKGIGYTYISFAIALTIDLFDRLSIYPGTKERIMKLMCMGEAIPAERSNDKIGPGAIPTSRGYIHVELKEDLRVGEQHLLGKQSPRDILEDTIKKGEWFKGIILSSAFFEHFASLKLREHFHGSISDDRIRNLNLGELIVFLLGLKLMTQDGYSKMMRVKNKRDDLAHYPFTKTDPKEAEHLISDTIQCLKELGAA